MNLIHKSIIFSVKLSCYDIARPFSNQMLIDTAFTRSCIFQQLKRDVVNFIRCYNQFGKQNKLRIIIFSYLHLLPDTQSLEFSVSDLKDIVLKDKMKCEKKPLLVGLLIHG